MNDTHLSSETRAVVLSKGSPLEGYDAAFGLHRDRLLSLCRGLVGDDADDVVQDVYLVGRERLEQLRRPEAIAAWLSRIAVNQCFQRHRRRQRLQGLIPRLVREDPPSSDLDLRIAIEHLVFRDRTIVVLHYGHGLELDEISVLLGLKAATVRSILFRARRRLRRLIEQHP